MPEDRSDLARVRAMADADIEFDEDSPRTTEGDWDGALIKQAGVAIGTVTARRRGAGKKPPRILTALRLPPDVLARWKASGPGWQTRMVELIAKRAP